MGTLLKWEMKQTFASKSFWIIGGALVTLPALMLFAALSFASEFTGYDAFLEGFGITGKFCCCRCTLLTHC